MAESGSLTVYPGAYDSAADTSNVLNPTRFVGKGTGNTEYASIYAYRKTNYAFWPFNLSSIPEDAEIDSVSCRVKAGLYYYDTTMTYTLRLFSGSTAKGAATNVTTKTATIYNLSTGTWTRDELSSIRLKTEAISSSSGANLYLYGADLTVAYTFNNEKFMLKLGGAWNDIARVFKKVSGIWVEQTDLANVIEDGVRYKNGGEYVAPVVVTIGGSFYYEYSWVKVNGNRYTSAASVEVEPGTEVQIYTSSAFASLRSSCGVKLNGTAVLSGAGTYTHIADRNCTITMKENVSDGMAYYSAEITTG